MFPHLCETVKFSSNFYKCHYSVSWGQCVKMSVLELRFISRTSFTGAESVGSWVDLLSNPHPGRVCSSQLARRRVLKTQNFSTQPRHPGPGERPPLLPFPRPVGFLAKSGSSRWVPGWQWRLRPRATPRQMALLINALLFAQLAFLIQM